MDITNILHPEYKDLSNDWPKWRLAYEGGRAFVEHYLKKFSQREENDIFHQRKEITPCPRFAGAAVDEVKNSIYQRMVDITRVDGSPSYQEAIKGGDYGVDLLGSSMNSFIGRKLLPELLTMKKVGVYVDMPMINDNLLINNYDNNNILRPYLYLYCAEDIKSWCMDEGANSNHFRSLLLCERQYNYCPVTNLPIDYDTYYKHLWVAYDEFTNRNHVYIRIYDSSSNLIDYPGSILIDDLPTIKLNIPRIPFVIFELSHSLMVDIADYQIAILNMNSSDISYSLKANFPFYIEQWDPRLSSPYLNNDVANENTKEEINIGPTSGRRYPLGANPPEFIHPSSEPLNASMRKQEQLKEEIKLLINLSITNIQPRMASAESKGMDERSLESGLSYIALELENGERQIGQIWSLYENNNNIPTVKYPEKYNLKSDEDRRKDAKQYNELLSSVPSRKYQEEVAKIIANILLGNRVSDDTLSLINKQIESAKIISIAPDIISQDVQAGLVSLETASSIRGYPEGEVEEAKKDHAERIARIAAAQSSIKNKNIIDNNLIDNNNSNNQAARGNPTLDNQDNNPNGKAEKQQSKDTTNDYTVGKTNKDKIRGTGK